MKKAIVLLTLGLTAIACQAPQESNVESLFERNAQIIRENIAGFTGENQDYSMYAEDFFMLNTTFGGTPDTMSVDDLKAEDAAAWANYDFEFLQDLDMLPGVEAGTGEPNASVRYYGAMKISKAGTNSTEAKSAVVRMYETFDLNEEGKITVQHYYGDFSAAMSYLNQ